MGKLTSVFRQVSAGGSIGIGLPLPSHAERPALEVAVGSASWLLSVLRLFLRLSLGSSSIPEELSGATCGALKLRSVKSCSPCGGTELCLFRGAASFMWAIVEGRSLEGVDLTDSPNSRSHRLNRVQSHRV